MDISEKIHRMEMALADPEVRKSARVMASLLHADFIEIGASGTVFDRAAIIALLETETDFTRYEIEDFTVVALGGDKALATYRIPSRSLSGGEKPGSFRSSLWILAGGTWQLRYHQGTRCA